MLRNKLNRCDSMFWTYNCPAQSGSALSFCYVKNRIEAIGVLPPSVHEWINHHKKALLLGWAYHTDSPNCLYRQRVKRYALYNCEKEVRKHFD